MIKITIGVVSTISLLTMAGGVPLQENNALDLFISSANAQTETQEVVIEQENQLVLPEDLEIATEEPRASLDSPKYRELEEYKVGGRLERVTVTWDNGVTEVYQNQRKDTNWSGDENKLGEAENVRQWRIGGW